MRIYQSRLVFQPKDVANKGRYIRCPLSIFLYQKMAVYMGGSAHFRSAHLLPIIFFIFFCQPVNERYM